MLAAQVRTHLARAGQGHGAPPTLVVVPHAGYDDSGDAAAHAYARLGPLAGRVRRVVRPGPAHRVAVRGIAGPSVGLFESPLGLVPLDRAALTALLHNAGLPPDRWLGDVKLWRYGATVWEEAPDGRGR